MQVFHNGKWIWNTACQGINTYGEFTATFSYADTIRIACDGNYALYLNGSLIGFGQYPGYEDMQFYDEYLIKDQIVPNHNQLQIIAHHPGRDTSTHRNSPAGVIFELWANGVSIAASTTETPSRPSPIYIPGETVGLVTRQLGFTFSMDLNRATDTNGHTQYANRSMDLSPRPIQKLQLKPDIPTRIVMEGGFTDTEQTGTAAKIMYSSRLIPRSYNGLVLPSENGIILSRQACDGCMVILDLGHEDAGFLSLDIDVAESCNLLVGWGEHLADGRVRTHIGERNFAASIKLHAGRNRIINPLLRLGLRYLQLHIYCQTCRLFYAGIQPTPYPIGTVHPAPINDPLHKKIYEVCTRTLMLCMHEHYEDCPWREQAFYSMDSRNQMLCGYYAFGEIEFARASILLMAHSLRNDGLLELCSPARVMRTIPSFTAVFPLMVWEYLDFSSDQTLAKQILPVLQRIAANFLLRLESNGLIRRYIGPQYWNFYEWQAGLDAPEPLLAEEAHPRFDAPLSAFVLIGLQALIKIYANLHIACPETIYESCNRIKNGLQAFWCDKQRCYASFLQNEQLQHYCELTNALLLYAGAVPEERISIIQNCLMDRTLIPITISHSIFKYDALLNSSDHAEWVLGDIAHIWGYMLDNGATSFWETIDGESAFDNAGSLCHGWSAIPIHIYNRIAQQKNNP